MIRSASRGTARARYNVVGAALLIGLILVLAGLVVAVRWTGPEQPSTHASSPKNVYVEREVHPLRHWMWSGIFPFEGGWIPDPHFKVTEVHEVGAEVGRLLGDPAARIQGVDINPWFADETSETVIAVEADGRVYEYSIDVRSQSLRYGFPNSGPIVTFGYRGQVGLFVLLEQQPFLVIVPLPLSASSPLQPHAPGSEGWKEVVAFLRQDERFRHLAGPFCELGMYYYASFFEQFAECP